MRDYLITQLNTDVMITGLYDQLECHCIITFIVYTLYLFYGGEKEKETCTSCTPTRRSGIARDRQPELAFSTSYQKQFVFCKSAFSFKIGHVYP